MNNETSYKGLAKKQYRRARRNVTLFLLKHSDIDLTVVNNDRNNLMLMINNVGVPFKFTSKTSKQAKR